MAVYSPTGSGDVHIDEVLTNISLDWPNNGLVGNALFPQVLVRKQSDKYYVFGREAWLPEVSDLRAPGTEAHEVPGLQVSTEPYFAEEHALQIPVTDEERENVDSPLAPDRDGTELVTSKIMLGRELAMRDLSTTVANYATGHSATVTNKWDVYATSDPIGDVKDARRAVHGSVFMEPNLAIIPYLVMSFLEDHPDIIERIKYSERAILTPEIIASVFGLERVIVPGVGVGTGPAGVPGSQISVGYLWGDDVVLAWVPGRAGLRIPAFAYEFVWSYGAGRAQVVDRWREEKRKSDLVRVSRRYDLKMIGVEIDSGSADFGKSITGYLLKDVLS